MLIQRMQASKAFVTKVTLVVLSVPTRYCGYSFCLVEVFVGEELLSDEPMRIARFDSLVDCGTVELRCLRAGTGFKMVRETARCHKGRPAKWAAYSLALMGSRMEVLAILVSILHLKAQQSDGDYVPDGDYFRSGKDGRKVHRPNGRMHLRVHSDLRRFCKQKCNGPIRKGAFLDGIANGQCHPCVRRPRLRC